MLNAELYPQGAVPAPKSGSVCAWLALEADAVSEPMRLIASYARRQGLSIREFAKRLGFSDDKAVAKSFRAAKPRASTIRAFVGALGLGQTTAKALLGELKADSISSFLHYYVVPLVHLESGTRAYLSDFSTDEEDWQLRAACHPTDARTACLASSTLPSRDELDHYLNRAILAEDGLIESTGPFPPFANVFRPLIERSGFAIVPTMDTANERRDLCFQIAAWLAEEAGLNRDESSVILSVLRSKFPEAVSISFEEWYRSLGWLLAQNSRDEYRAVVGLTRRWTDEPQPADSKVHVAGSSRSRRHLGVVWDGTHKVAY